MTTSQIAPAMTAAEINARMTEIGDELAANNRYGGYPKARELENEWEYLKSNYERVLTSGGTLERFQTVGKQ